MASNSSPNERGPRQRTSEIFKVPGAGRIRRKQLPVFSRLMAAMLDSGMPVVQVLNALEQENPDKAFKAVITNVRARIEGGESLSQAMSHYPDVFEEMYLSMIEAGEAGGLLSSVMSRLAQFLEDSQKLRRKVMSAMMYPAMVSIVTLIITTIMLVWMVPGFVDIYKGFDAELPTPTKVLVAISNGLRHYFPVVILGIILAIVGLKQYTRTEGGGIQMDRFKLKLPVFGELLLKVSLARFSSTFASLIRSGVPILRAMEIVSSAIGNRALGKILWEARSRIEGGESLSAALEAHPEYPRLLVQMLASGEKSGKVDEMLMSISKLYEDEVNTTIAGLTSLIEPLLIVMLGVVIGAIVICLFLPIFNLTKVISI
jgi:type IV pilus assembly protein PilC